MGKAVGIDFGTSNSVVASFVEGKAKVLADDKGNNVTPSVVSFGKNKQILVGHDAKTQGIKNPRRTVQSIKRLIGRKIFSSEVKKSQVLLSFDLIEGENQNVAVKVDDEVYTPQEIAAFILAHMKDIAEKATGDSVTDAVITVPAYFNDNQRLATKEAAEIAGLQVLRMINEPTAAALAYGFGKSLDETIVVYDLGGGTFDISILKLKDKVFEVIATAGDTFLGGDDFDDRIIDILAEEFLKKHEVDLRKIPEALPLLRSNAEKTKRRLSYAERSDLYIPSIFKKDGQTLDLHFSLSRDQLKQSTKDLIQRTFKVCDEALGSAKLSVSDVNAVILVGGPTKMPLIADAVQDYFGKKPLNDLNPDEVVAIGAAIQAQSLKTAATEKKALLIDVTPLDLGVATVDGFTETLIDKNSPIPMESSKVFATTVDNQEKVDIRIYQGKNRRVEESHLLGEFSLSGFPKKKAGEVAIKVNFAIDTDGIVNVAAIEEETGVEQKVSVKLSAAMGAQNVQASAEKAKKYQAVKLQDQWKDASKVLLYRCGESRMNSEYLEGYIKNFHPEDPQWTLHSDQKAEKDRVLEKNQIAWTCLINDFANIPRYLKALTEKPEKIGQKPQGQLYEFKLVNGESIYGQADLPKSTATGFWVIPYFPQDKLSGRVYIYNSKIRESIPITAAALAS